MFTVDDIKFPSTIEYIHIFNASNVTKELPLSLLEAIRSVHFYPEKISIVPNFVLDNDTILYIIICPAGLGSERYNQGPKYYITYQLDPCPPAPTLVREPYQKFLKDAIYNWDYSQKNINFLANIDIKGLYISPGFTYSMSKDDISNGSYLYSDTNKNIDILFLGWDIYERRRLIKESLLNSGLKVWFVCHLDNEGMKVAVRNSKICINIHASENWPCLETIRLNILLSNQTCIVCEDIDDPEINIYKDHMAIVPYDKLVSTCCHLIQNPEQRKRLALKSHQWYRSHREWSKIINFNSLLPSLTPHNP